jgi:hypothetical protein
MSSRWCSTVSLTSPPWRSLHCWTSWTLLYENKQDWRVSHPMPEKVEVVVKTHSNEKLEVVVNSQTMGWSLKRLSQKPPMLLKRISPKDAPIQKTKSQVSRKDYWIGIHLLPFMIERKIIHVSDDANTISDKEAVVIEKGQAYKPRSLFVWCNLNWKLLPIKVNLPRWKTFFRRVGIGTRNSTFLSGTRIFYS